MIASAVEKYLQANPPQPGRDGKDGLDGKDGASGLDGKDGANGVDGVGAASALIDRNGDLVLTMTDGSSRRLGPVVGRNGADGNPGPAGKDGRDGKDADPPDAAAIAKAVEAHLNANPPAAGRDGKDGAQGPSGRDGADGIGAASALVDRNGELVLTMTDGSSRHLGRVVGKDGMDGKAGPAGKDGQDGADGKDGADGVGFDDFDLIEDERGLTLRFQRGQTVKEFPLPLPTDRGVWVDREYRKGSGVTWAGSFWIAQRDTAAKPDTANSGWRLAVKRGRDGKDGKPGGSGK